MSTIRCVYSEEPNFPATDQHADAVRYQIGGRWVDALGGEPTLAEVEAFVNPPPPSQDELETAAKAYFNGGAPTVDPRKLFKAKVISDLAFRLGKAPGTLTNAELAAERDRIAAIYKAL